MSDRYRCWFQFRGRELFVDDNEIAQFLAGFWLTSDLNYARWCNSQAKYFIPAGQILYVEKLK